MSGAIDAKYYLQDHRIPQLFEGLMTGLIFHRPVDPLEYLERAIIKVRTQPNMAITWDMFIAENIGEANRNYPGGQPPKTVYQPVVPRPVITTNTNEEPLPEINESEYSKEPSRTNTVEHRSPEPRLESEEEMVVHRVPSVTKAAEVARIPEVPVILFMGGPGGGKTRHAAKVADALMDQGLVHICMPDIIRSALAKYKDKYPEWKEANEHYMRGELIPNQLALMLLKAEMGRHPNAHGFFLEGYPREARQVEDFERQVKSVNMALILDYDERTLREHMERRGLGMEIIDQKIKEFKQKTLPSAKYFDDQKLLHLIPGEKEDQVIYERMKSLVLKALETGVPVLNTKPPSSHRKHLTSPKGDESQDSSRSAPIEAQVENTTIETAVDENHAVIREPVSKPRSQKQSRSVANGDFIEPIGLPNNAPVILVLGAPGSQKNEIGRRITQKYDGFTLLSMGEILRKKVNSEKNDPLWEKVGKKMSHGESIPTKICRSILYEELQSRGNTNWGYVIEGYPKSSDQLAELEHALQRMDLAILIDCTEQFCLETIKKRNKENHRADDSDESVAARMDFFKRNTLPMLKSLDERGKLRVVDGDSDPDTVFKDVVQVIDGALFIEDDGDGTSLGDSKKGALQSSNNSSAVQ
ncbi:unnamed protein product [Caenorhabditis bovis]|uniref:Adenylate kinase isoenzyme 5 n=1 Tax=Caenorhabditis bovis TaxID=2654633 RepID=A0A8S1FDS4_9PELO|nr:unnamed protein product [Caenorhabditis bovis]